jgi:predicted transcriptional regulator
MNQETYTKYYNEVPKQIFSLCRVFETRSRLALFIIILKEHPITIDQLMKICNYEKWYLNEELDKLMIGGVIECVGEWSEDGYKKIFQPTRLGELLMKKLHEAVLFIE